MTDDAACGVAMRNRLCWPHGCASRSLLERAAMDIRWLTLSIIVKWGSVFSEREKTVD